MANPHVNRSRRRLLVAAGLAILAVSACQGPSESEQTGSLGRPHAVMAVGGHAARTAAIGRGARS